MIIHRRTHTESIDVGGVTTTLATRTWTLGVDHRHGGAGWSYRRPCHIEVAGDTTTVRRRIHDFVMVARMIAVAALMSLSLLRRIRHAR